MDVDMDRGSQNRNPLAAARDFLHCVIQEQKAATEALLASNRELETLLDEVLATRTDLRRMLEAETGSDALPAPRSKPLAGISGLRIGELRRDVEQALEKGSMAVRDSSRLRHRSRKLRELLRRPPDPARTTPAPDSLSRRERQVLALIVQGKSSKQIAADLGISFKTAVTHRASIMSKFDVHEIAAVVREAIRRGLV